VYDAAYRQIAAYARLDEAELARGLLESEGIQVALLDGQMSALGLGAAVGGVRILVPAWEVLRAVDLLADPPAADEADAALTPAPSPVARAAGPAPAPDRASLATRITVGIAVLLASGLLAVAFR
jgi:hypothetical protein